MTTEREKRLFTCRVGPQGAVYYAECEDLKIRQYGDTAEDAIGRLRKSISNTFPTDDVELIVDGNY